MYTRMLMSVVNDIAGGIIIVFAVSGRWMYKGIWGYL